MKKETFTEKLIKHTYGISGPLDEYKRREADRIGNQVFIILFYLMIFGNLIPLLLAYKYPQEVALIYPPLILVIALIAAGYVTYQMKKTGITAIDNAQKRLAPYIEKGMVTFIKDNFRHLQARLREASVQEIDGICYDLGVSSPQLDQRERGFSYKKDAPLDMRMNQDASLTAYEVVNHYDYHDLVRIFFKYGEDKFSKQIARKIEQAREVKPIETTTELAEIIKSAKPAKELKKKGHPAKQIFQAIRIEVNDELGAADESIQQAMEMLALDGRISVITFHSLEDRLTKQLFKEASTVEVPKGLPFIPDDLKPKMELVSRKPILPSAEELEANNRSHSAKLRVARKIHK